jgi:hypothetical protein
MRMISRAAKPGVPSLDGGQRPFDERAELIERLRACVAALPADAATRDLREVFLRRYVSEIYVWRSRRDRFRRAAMAISVCVGALGAVSSGIAGVQGDSRSPAATTALVVIGVLIAVFTAISQGADMRATAGLYRRDELQLRRLGWQYLRQIEEGTAPDVAYASFQQAVSEALDRDHSLPFTSERPA